MAMIELPNYCAARHPVTGDPIMLRKGEAGYVPWPKTNPISPEDFNKVHDIDEAVVQTMMACSMSGGWEKANVPKMREALRRGRERMLREEYRPRRRWSDK